MGEKYTLDDAELDQGITVSGSSVTLTPRKSFSLPKRKSGASKPAISTVATKTGKFHRECLPPEPTRRFVASPVPHRVRFNSGESKFVKFVMILCSKNDLSQQSCQN